MTQQKKKTNKQDEAKGEEQEEKKGGQGEKKKSIEKDVGEEDATRVTTGAQETNVQSRRRMLTVEWKSHLPRPRFHVCWSCPRCQVESVASAFWCLPSSGE